MALLDINIGTSPNDGTGDDLRSGGIKINQNFADVKTFTGWAEYRDTQYTSGSPFALTANTLTDLPNNAGAKLEIQKPADIPKFYDETTQKILGRNGDGLSWVIEMTVVPSVNATYVDFLIDIGGAVGAIYPDIKSFPKGAGVPRNIIYAIPAAYTLGTWETNGGTVKIESNGACDIYNIRYVFSRTHRNRTI